MADLVRKKELKPKQIQALILLAEGKSHRSVAEAVGVSQKTLSIWKREDLFHKEFKKAMERMRYEFEARIVAAGQNAVVAVNKELENPSAELRIKAGATLVNAAVRLGARYKELEVTGAIPTTPIVVFPEGTNMPWNAKPIGVDIEASKAAEKDEVVEAELVQPQQLESGEEDGD